MIRLGRTSYVNMAPLGEPADARLLIGDAVLRRAFEDPTPRHALDPPVVKVVPHTRYFQSHTCALLGDRLTPSRGAGRDPRFDARAPESETRP